MRCECVTTITAEHAEYAEKLITAEDTEDAEENHGDSTRRREAAPIGPRRSRIRVDLIGVSDSYLGSSRPDRDGLLCRPSASNRLPPFLLSSAVESFRRWALSHDAHKGTVKPPHLNDDRAAGVLRTSAHNPTRTPVDVGSHSGKARPRRGRTRCGRSVAARPPSRACNGRATART